MNKFKLYFIVLITSVSLFSCSKNDSVAYEPPVEYSVQYPIDNAIIEDFLTTNYFTVLNHPGFVDDQDVTFTKIPAGGSQPSIMTFLNSGTYPKLLLKIVTLNDVAYNLYYLVLRPGVGVAPCSADGVLTSYKGTYLYRTAATTTTTAEVTETLFEQVKYPQNMLSLYTLITGWSETFPYFKTGNSVTNTDGTVTHTDFGAGVMFIPSGLGYYNNGQGAIPAYSPLIFSFKLYEIQRLDQDGDGIPSYLEDSNNDGFMRVLPVGVANPDDTDGDGIPDFLDVDDDGDNYTTTLEIKNPATGIAFPFANIPTCTSGKKNYLDASCHP